MAAGGGLTTTTDFVYEGLLLQSLSASQTGTGATSWKLTYLYDERGRPYAGLYRSPASSTGPVVFALVTTDRGDVVGLLDAEGSPFAAYRYDAWGNPQGSGDVATGLWSQSTGLISSQLASDIARRQVLRYASYCYDTESGLYYLSARSYDPQTRQFLSKDLSRNDGEQSAYQYCLGNPVRYVDPTVYRVDDDGYRANLWRIVNSILRAYRSSLNSYGTWTNAYAWHYSAKNRPAGQPKANSNVRPITTGLEAAGRLVEPPTPKPPFREPVRYDPALAEGLKNAWDAASWPFKQHTLVRMDPERDSEEEQAVVIATGHVLDAMSQYAKSYGTPFGDLVAAGFKILSLSTDHVWQLQKKIGLRTEITHRLFPPKLRFEAHKGGFGVGQGWLPGTP